jgi:GNAT superfamily N-acetyltransferase
MAGEKPIIRRMDEGDLPAVGELLVECWQSTFRGLLPDSFLDAMSPADQSARIARIMRRAGVACFVATGQQGGVIGYAAGGPSRGAETFAPFELYAIYVRPGQQRQAVGRRLFQAVSGTGGGRPVFTWALAINPFRSFYERQGGRQAGTGMIELGGTSYEMVGYLWAENLAG